CSPRRCPEPPTAAEDMKRSAISFQLSAISRQFSADEGGSLNVRTRLRPVAFHCFPGLKADR
ncbi:MAG TPA: hypothetical protein VK477_05625, partial [Acidobacteriota bacterium]|nr:hypothetical protein [Acidobacteriota bacterium]